MGPKRVQSSSSRPNKKARTFKVRAIEIEPAATNATPARPSSSQPTTYIHDTRSYQVYSLSDGRLGMRHASGKVSVTVPPMANSSESTDERDRMVNAVLEHLPVEEAERLEAPSFDPYEKKRRKRPELRASNKVKEWLPLRQEFLDELIRFAGTEYPVADTEKVRCRDCDESGAMFRCTECDTRPFYCEDCIVAKHRDLALHRLERWDGKGFTRVTLRELGLTVQLGHDGEECDCPAPTLRRIAVCDLTGTHVVDVRFCECLDDVDMFIPEWVQLFRRGWFPATTNRPATVFTFRLLDFFQELNFQAKTNLYDFWKTLERVTDNTGGSTPLNRYTQISHCVRLWRHLVLLKRAGRGHDPGGPDATQQGELAIECPACPQPGKNIPDDWESAPDDIKWLYTLFLMCDANFRAKLKDRGFDSFELGSGWSYFAETRSYQQHLEQAGDQDEKNECSAEHQAILKANLRREGYLASGVGAVLCARHALVRKNAAGDVPNGEKYAIMDYLVFSTLVQLMLMYLISYDIACQWHKRLPIRMQALPEHLQRDLAHDSVRYAIPKKHIRVHGPNHSRFSLNYLPKVGRTYGEGIEAHWSHMNPVATSAREMGPGVRHEFYNDHWSAWNWQKTIGFAVFLLRSLREADTMRTAQEAAHRDFSSTMDDDALKRWEAEVAAWQADPQNAPDLYEEPRPTATYQSVRLKIAEEEAQELAAGTLPPHDVSPGVFIQVGLELEEQQRNLKIRQARGATATSTLADLQEKRNTLTRRIESWQAIQDAHTPIVAQLRHPGNGVSSALRPAMSQLQPLLSSAPPASHTDSLPASTSAPRVASPASAPSVEDIRLWLPSAIPPTLRAAAVPSGLVDKEQRLRIAQADDALEDLRRCRRILTGVNEFRRYNVDGLGQRTEGKVRTVYSNFKDKQQRAAERYRAARGALLSLNLDGDWRLRFKELKQSDIRGPGRDDNTALGEGYFEISWIWLVPRNASEQSPTTLDQNEFLENVKVEWARSQARAARWGEEVKLLEEEMRRVIEYFEWRTTWWRRRESHRVGVEPALQRGLAAYAERQARVFEGLAYHCAELWVPYLRKHRETLPKWSDRYSIPEKKGKSRSCQLPASVSESSDTESSSGSVAGGHDT